MISARPQYAFNLMMSYSSSVEWVIRQVLLVENRLVVIRGAVLDTTLQWYDNMVTMWLHDWLKIRPITEYAELWKVPPLQLNLLFIHIYVCSYKIWQDNRKIILRNIVRYPNCLCCKHGMYSPLTCKESVILGITCGPF